MGSHGETYSGTGKSLSSHTFTRTPMESEIHSSPHCNPCVHNYMLHVSQYNFVDYTNEGHQGRVVTEKKALTNNCIILNPQCILHKPRLHCPGTRPGSLKPADQGEPGRILNEFECVHTFPSVRRARPGLGQKVITLCPGYATACDSAFPVQPRRHYSVFRCVPIHHDSASGIGGRAQVSLRRGMEVGRQNPGVTRQQMNINAIAVELITHMSFAKYRTQVTYKGKN